MSDGAALERRGGVPAARQVLALLQALARHPAPLPAAVLARDLGLPRSTTYHLLGELLAAGLVVHLPEERRYGLGPAAFELGTQYLRQAPLARLGRPVLARLVEAAGHTAHLATLHGGDVLYLIEERATGRPPLVTDVDVRLPAHLTATGRAMLAELPPQHVRALYPSRGAFVLRHGSGPSSLPELRRVLAEARRAGHATEDGEVTPGFASVAVAVHDHTGLPAAAVAVTYPADDPAADPDRLARHVTRAAGELSRRIGGAPARVV